MSRRWEVEDAVPGYKQWQEQRETWSRFAKIKPLSIQRRKKEKPTERYSWWAMESQRWRDLTMGLLASSGEK